MTASDAVHLARLRGEIAARDRGDGDLDAVAAALESTPGLLEGPAAELAEAIRATCADLETIRLATASDAQSAAIAPLLAALQARLAPVADVVEGNRDLCHRLLDRTLTPLAFETALLALRRQDLEGRTGAVGDVLDRLSYVVEEYVDDPDLREPGTRDLDADGLRAGARRFLDETADRR